MVFPRTPHLEARSQCLHSWKLLRKRSGPPESARRQARLADQVLPIVLVASGSPWSVCAALHAIFHGIPAPLATVVILAVGVSPKRWALVTLAAFFQEEPSWLPMVRPNLRPNAAAKRLRVC